MDLFSNWRVVYFLFNIPLRFYFACQTSYIHPDEHFQTFQALFHDNFPWEFKNPNFINRSIVPLWLVYKPTMALGEWLNLSELGIYHLFRFNLVFWNWIIVDWCIYRIMPFKHERIKALFFIATSWVTLSLQSHTFSNSIETFLLLPCVYIINDIRSYLESSNGKNYSKFKLFSLGCLISIGVFNRITFIAWLILPSIFLLKYFTFHPIRGLIPPLSFILSSLLIIAIDTSYFHKIDLLIVIRMLAMDLNFKALQLKSLPLNLWVDIISSNLHHSSSFVIAPLNNLIYNLQEDNLQDHGIHPRYLHLLVNYPLITGPLILLLPPFKLKYWRTTPFLTCISGMFILSLVKHQELRFLIPMVPLLSSLVTLDSESLIPSQAIIKLWIIYSLLLSIFYNMIHQAGIVPSMVEINDLILNTNTYSTTSLPPVLIFWRTLKPPTWMLNVQHLEFTHDGVNKSLLTPHYLTKFDSIVLETGVHDLNVIDLMGSPICKLESIYNGIDHSKQNVYLITPKNSLMWLENYQLDELWSTNWHIDMDHFEFNEFKWETFKFGLGIYKLNDNHL